MKHSIPLGLCVVVLLSISSATTAQKKKPDTSKKPAPLIAPVKQTAPVPGWLTTQEEEVLTEINLARANPVAYARYLEDFKRQYQGNQVKYADGTSFVTNEGVVAVSEAIEFLKETEPQPPLQIRKGLIDAARLHLRDMITTGKTGHRGSDGSVPEERFKRFGSWSESVGENIVYQSRSARENVIWLIIDDGTSNRGHRKNIFKPAFRVAGVAIDGPAKTNSMCVITFAGAFTDSLSPANSSATAPARKMD